MARIVNEKPQLPLTPSRTIEEIGRNQNDLVTQLQGLFFEYGFRLNNSYQNDGTESASILRITDGVSAPAAVVGAAFIYVDIADGDLKVKFGDGFVTTIGADS